MLPPATIASAAERLERLDELASIGVALLGRGQRGGKFVEAVARDRGDGAGILFCQFLRSALLYQCIAGRASRPDGCHHVGNQFLLI